MQFFRNFGGIMPANARSRHLDDFFNDRYRKLVTGSTSDDIQLPPVNVEEHSKAYILAIAIPGFNKSEIEINTQNGILTISAEKKQQDSDTSPNYVFQEFATQRFQRQFQLPDHVDEDRIEAKQNDGILRITLPLKEKSAPEVRRPILVS